MTPRVFAVVSATFAVALFLAAQVSAGAADPPRQTFSAGFGTAKTGKPTSLTQAIDYLPAPGTDKPYAVSKVTFKLPPGSRINTAAVPRCEASDAELMATGAGACPSETVVGSGELTADTGAPDGLTPRIVETDVTLLNAEDEVILFAESTNTPAPIRLSARIEIVKRKLISTVPPIPGAGPPEPFLAIDEVLNKLDRIRTRDGIYIRTPRECPRRGNWRIWAVFEYRDGVSQKVISRTPCA